MAVPRLRLNTRQQDRLRALRAARAADTRPLVETDPTAWKNRSCRSSSILADDLTPCRTSPTYRVTTRGHGWESSDFYCEVHLPRHHRDTLTAAVDGRYC